ncbi:MAG: glutathione S-transferase N-terminal domain-containing protein, partial [Solirubrobacteraceae bacterium]|nr:glutathione S-transferase N-terminal domain-containing protein [Solirubrobacteraceae bacterium]
ARAALRFKGLQYERVDLPLGQQIQPMEELYGEGNTTVPGLLVDGEPVHGSRAILARLEEIQPEPPLYPAEIADRVLEAERWGDEVFQDLGRRLPWGALYFRPEALGLLAGATEPLDPAGTDYAIRMIRGTWKYHGLDAVKLADDLTALPGYLDHIDALIADGTLGGEQPNAADLQIGATLRVLMSVEDLLPLLLERPATTLAERFFPRDRIGGIPAGAYPAGWVPARS